MSRDLLHILLQDFQAKPNTAFAKALGQRIADERKACGYTLKQAGEMCGISHAYFSQIEHGRRIPPGRVLLEVCSWRRKGENWFLFGDKGIYEAVRPEQVAAERVAAAAELVIEHLGGYTDEPVEAERFGEAVKEVMHAYGQQPRPRRFQVAGRVSADPQTAIEWDAPDPPEWIEIPGDARPLQVMSESMEPVILKGQWIFVTEDDLLDGDLVAVEFGPRRRAKDICDRLPPGARVFKRWYWRGSQLAQLISVRDEPPMLVNVDDLSEVLVVFAGFYRQRRRGS